MMKVFAVSCLLALAGAAPAPDADPALLATAVIPTNCKTEIEVLVTQTCVPSPKVICTTKTVDSEEIEYEKVCKEVVDTICDAPVVAAPAFGYHANAIAKREADAVAEPDAEADAVANPDAEADPVLFAANPYAAEAENPFLAFHPNAHAIVATLAAHHAAAVPVAAHAVAHSVIATVKLACREVTTEHCVDNPKIKPAPVEVETCHTITQVTCSDINNEIPKTTCEAIETTHVSYAAYAAPVAYGNVK